MFKKHKNNENKNTLSDDNPENTTSSQEKPSEPQDSKLESASEKEIKNNAQAGGKVSSDELAVLRKKIEELEKKNAEAEDRTLRLRADFDNFRKRASREMADARISARTDTIIPVLNVFDHFKLAVSASDDSKDFNVLHDGMKIILSEFEKAMAELGISTINAVGQKFDPNIHEAIGKQHSETHKEGIIISQWRLGYKLGDKLIRPCAVIVSDGPEKKELPPATAEKTEEKNDAAAEDK